MRSSLRRSIPIAQFEVESQHVDHLFVKEAVHRHICIGSNEFVDLGADLDRIALEVRRPFRGYAIELIFGVLHRDVGIESGS